MHSEVARDPVAHYTFIKSVNNKPKGRRLHQSRVALLVSPPPQPLSPFPLSLPSSSPRVCCSFSSLPSEERGGPREGNLQISSINHKPESNVTNILQLEETAVGSEPSISSPHDPPFIGCCSHSFRHATHTQTHTHTHTHTHARTCMRVQIHRCTNRLDRK